MATAVPFDPLSDPDPQEPVGDAYPGAPCVLCLGSTIRQIWWVPIPHLLSGGAYKTVDYCPRCHEEHTVGPNTLWSA